MFLSKLIKIINGESNIDSYFIIKEIKTDTRKLNEGDIFIALKGDKYDGNNYVEDAIKKGCIACITNKYISDKCIVVKDTYKSLFDIGNYIRNKHNIPVIAITGSNGKTTTKELIVHILKTKYNVLYNKESLNNLIGVSDVLFKLNNKYDICVLELGSNHIGEISLLSKLCNPTTSIIVNIGTSHIGYFKKKKNIFKEKLSILDGMKNNNLIVNGDDQYLKKLNYFKCGINKNNNLQAYNIQESIDSILFNIKLDKEYTIKFNNPGKHFITNILLAIKVCMDYGINIDDIVNSINNFKLIDKRMNVFKLEDNTIINDCYNASFESVKAGLNYMKKINQNKIFIIGDLLELGKFSKRIHKKINRLLKKIKNKQVYTIGRYSKYIKGISFNNVNEMISYLKNKKFNNSYIYIKGSRRNNLDLVVEYLKKRAI